MRTLLRLAIQELIVITEPGTTYVIADSTSSAYGTPQNEVLQSWKNNLTKTNSELAILHQRIKEASTTQDSLLLASFKDSLIIRQQDFNYQILMQNDSNTLGRFIHSMAYHSLREEQKKSLDNLSH